MSSVESRKVQVGAGGSYLLVLPKDWARRVGLKRGDRLDVLVEEDGSLRVLPPSARKAALRQAELSLEDVSGPQWLDRSIKAAYMQGCDVISIVSKDRIPPDLKKTIRSTTLDLVGMEIADVQHDRMVLRILVDPAKFPLRELRERAFSLLLSMIRDLIASLEKGEKGYAYDVIDREAEVTKLYRLMIRQSMLAIRDRDIAKAIGVERLEDNITNVMMARDLLQLTFLNIRLARSVLSLNDKVPSNVSEPILEMFKSVYNMVEKVFRAASTNDLADAHSVIDQMERIRAMDSEIMRDLLHAPVDIETALTLIMIVRDIRRMAGCAVAIADSIITGATPSKPSVAQQPQPAHR
ncbi:hypothetical protein B6U99_06560 [Candidatus Geothermarchaeota archaeon ex4572_27]|nr:MAG: hypothetical protein B6U99_06560 [Candidatus Geothermarchaeota archaeon ex4572_27]